MCTSLVPPVISRQCIRWQCANREGVYVHLLVQVVLMAVEEEAESKADEISTGLKVRSFFCTGA